MNDYEDIQFVTTPQDDDVLKKQLKTALEFYKNPDLVIKGQDWVIDEKYEKSVEAILDDDLDVSEITDAKLKERIKEFKLVVAMRNPDVLFNVLGAKNVGMRTPVPEKDEKHISDVFGLLESFYGEGKSVVDERQRDKYEKWSKDFVGFLMDKNVFVWEDYNAYDLILKMNTIFDAAEHGDENALLNKGLKLANEGPRTVEGIKGGRGYEEKGEDLNEKIDIPLLEKLFPTENYLTSSWPKTRVKRLAEVFKAARANTGWYHNLKRVLELTQKHPDTTLSVIRSVGIPVLTVRVIAAVRSLREIVKGMLQRVGEDTRMGRSYFSSNEDAKRIQMLSLYKLPASALFDPRTGKVRVNADQALQGMTMLSVLTGGDWLSVVTGLIGGGASVASIYPLLKTFAKSDGGVANDNPFIIDDDNVQNESNSLYDEINSEDDQSGSSDSDNDTFHSADEAPDDRAVELTDDGRGFTQLASSLGPSDTSSALKNSWRIVQIVMLVLALAVIMVPTKAVWSTVTALISNRYGDLANGEPPKNGESMVSKEQVDIIKRVVEKKHSPKASPTQTRQILMELFMKKSIPGWTALPAAVFIGPDGEEYTTQEIYSAMVALPKHAKTIGELGVDQADDTLLDAAGGVGSNDSDSEDYEYKAGSDDDEYIEELLERDEKVKAMQQEFEQFVESEKTQHERVKAAGGGHDGKDAVKQILQMEEEAVRKIQKEYHRKVMEELAKERVQLARYKSAKVGGSHHQAEEDAMKKLQREYHQSVMREMAKERANAGGSQHQTEEDAMKKLQREYHQSVMREMAKERAAGKASGKASGKAFGGGRRYTAGGSHFSHHQDSIGDDDDVDPLLIALDEYVRG